MKNRKKKIGQISLEFLTTYGWAMLVALIAIGALAYFGVLNPAKYTPKRCVFGTEMSCADFRLTLKDETCSAGGGNTNCVHINVRLQNNVGAALKVDNVTLSNDASSPIACPENQVMVNGNPPKIFSSNYDWNDGATIDITANCTAGTGGFSAGNKNKVKMRIRYYDPVSGSSYGHVVNGEMYDEVQKI